AQTAAIDVATPAVPRIASPTRPHASSADAPTAARTAAAGTTAPMCHGQGLPVSSNPTQPPSDAYPSARTTGEPIRNTATTNSTEAIAATIGQNRCRPAT